MKKATIEALYNYLSEKNDDCMMDIKAELEAELNKGKAKADASKAEYAEIYNAVMEVLRGTTQPVTAQELADETGCPKGKIVYGLSHYWMNDVTKIEGKVNSYALKS